MRYSDLTRAEYFEAARHAGVLEAKAAGRGDAGNIASGTWVQFDVRPAGGKIAEARFQAFGCPHTIAIASWLADRAPGLLLAARLPESVHALRERFEAPVEKLGRILMVENAWCAAIRAAITIC